jgi:hypothetical protein
MGQTSPSTESAGKWFEPKTMCPLIAVRDREERWPGLVGHVDRGRCDLRVTRRHVRLRRQRQEVVETGQAAGVRVAAIAGQAGLF